jgi:hypothetical protein
LWKEKRGEGRWERVVEGVGMIQIHFIMIMEISQWNSFVQLIYPNKDRINWKNDLNNKNKSNSSTQLKKEINW